MINLSKPPVICVILMLAFSLSAADAQEPLRLTRLMESIQLDGISDEPEWQKIEPLPMTMNRPNYPGEPTEKTEIRLAYDKDYLYCAVRCYDSDPSGIRVNSLYRDRSSKDDKFGIILDTFNDKNSALSLKTSESCGYVGRC